MLEGVLVPSLICMVCGGFFAVIGRFLAFVWQILRCVWRFWYQKGMQEAVSGVIENHSKLGLEGFQIIKNETSGRFGGVVGSTRLQARKM